NDGSKDNTIDLLRKFQKGQENRVLVYDMPQNGGKAEAVRQGINHMLKNTTVGNVGFIDADLATGFDDYRSLVLELRNPLNRKEMVFASRKMENDQDVNRSYFRNLASCMVGKWINKIIGLPILDTQCGAKVFSRSLAGELFKKSFISKWLFDVELFIRTKNYYGKSSVMEKVQEKAIQLLF
ncbi:MAG: glycosyltransferase, partial [Bacteroidota bacterium]